MMLEKNGFEVVDEAENGQAGWEIQKHQPDLVTMDITKSKSQPVANLIYYLGIPVWQKHGKDLAQHFGSLENIMNATYEELLEVNDVD